MRTPGDDRFMADGAAAGEVRRRGKALAAVVRDEPWPEIMTAEEAAAYLRVTKDKLYGLVKDGVVPAARLGRDWRFRFADLEALFTTGHGATDFDA